MTPRARPARGRGCEEGGALTTGTGPVLLACSHGTASPDGRRAIADLRAGIAELRPGLEVVPAYVDVERPHVAEVVADLVARGRRCVVVPLLLSAGHHVRVDIARAVAQAGGHAVAARALGPDPALVDVLVERLAEAGAGSGDTLVGPGDALVGPGDAVLLAAAGSSDERATQDVRQVAARLGERLRHPVTACLLASAEPVMDVPVPDVPVLDVPVLDEAVAAARDGAQGGYGRVVVVTYLMGPGRLADGIAERARHAGAGAVTRPLAGHPALARLALARYDEAVTELGRG